MGDFAGIPWGKQGQCCLSAKWEILQVFPGVAPTRSVLSNAKWEILQVFPGVHKVSVV